MENEIINHDTIYPPSASGGGENAYYLRGCEVVQRSPSYASCLFKIGEQEAGRKNELHAECASAGSRCAARAMRDEERLQGKALYYFPRKPPQALHLPVSVTGDFGVRITNLTPPELIPRQPNSTPSSKFLATIGKSASGKTSVAPKKPDSFLDSIDSGGYAEAINATPAPSPAQEKKPVTRDDLAKLALPGESMIETAKRLLNKVKEPA